MQWIHSLIEAHLPIAWLVLVAGFLLLAKCADIFVDSSVALANRFRIPRLIIGIVLVSLATTAPELSVSLIAALEGNPEMALGNAVGSVICNTGLAGPCPVRRVVGHDDCPVAQRAGGHHCADPGRFRHVHS